MTTVLLVAALLTLAGCGENDDTIWTGVSGVVIFLVIAITAARLVRKRKAKP